MITQKLKIVGILILLSWFLSGCATKKYLNNDEQFVNKYKVAVENKPNEIELGELKSFFRPKQNSKIFGIRWKLSTYYKLQNKKQTKFRKWLFKSFGEEPRFV